MQKIIQLRYGGLEKVVELDEIIQVFEEQGNKDYKYKSGHFRSDKQQLKHNQVEYLPRKKLGFFKDDDRIAFVEGARITVLSPALSS